MPNHYDEPLYWFTEMRRSEQYRSRAAAQYEWDKLKTIWDTGAHKVAIEVESTKQSPTELSQSAFVNWIWSFSQTFLPAVYWKHPQINVREQHPSYQANTEFVKPIINRAMDLTKFRRELLKVIQDVLVYGHGWIKLGWFTRFGQVPGTVANPAAASNQKLSEIDTDANYLLDNPYTNRISPEKLLVDPEAETYDEIRWIAQESFVPFEAVKKDPYLKNTRDLSPTIMTNEKESGYVGMTNLQGAESRENKWCRIYEIWDRINQRVRIIVQGSRKWNRELDWPYPDINAFPYKLCTVTDAIDELYPVSPVLPWLPLVDELAFLRSIRMEHLQKMVPKALIPQGVMDEDQFANFLDPGQEAVITQGSPKEIDVWEGLKPDANLYASEDGIKQDIREISGFSELLSGSVPFSRIAATTSAIMEKNATLRFDFYSERVGDFIIDCAKDLFLIMRRYQQYPQVVRVVGDPEPRWLDVTEEDMRGDFLFSLDLEEMSVSSKQQRIKEAYDALITLSQFPEVKRETLVRDFLTAAGKTPLADYMHPAAGPPLDPNYENQIMANGLPVEPNPQEDFELHLRVHADFLQSPQFAQLASRQPAISALFSEHVQKTNRMAALQAQLGPPVGQGAASQAAAAAQNQSLQQGQANASAQPVGGATNAGQGGGFNALASALSQAGRQ